MSINFCQEHHSPVISSSHVCRDGYDVHNLIAINQAIKKNGFWAEYFIRPPVDILIKFPIPIEISHILLGVKIGENQTTGLEIWSQYLSANNHCNTEEKFELIGKRFNITESYLLFINNQYSPRKHFSKLPKNILSSNIVTYRFNAKFYANLSSVNSLRISLIKVLRSDSPVLSKLEVWGQPARSCQESIVLSVLEAEQNYLPSSSTTSSNNKDQFCKTDSQDLENQNLTEIVDNYSFDDDDDLDIPSEFIDPITCEIMTLPVVLPSGHTVDQSTIEKYIETEASWGRFPNDPFTGVLFKSDQKPVPNSSLKVRIDQFLIKNNNLFSHIPRTVGNKQCQNSINLKTSSLLASDAKMEAMQGIKRLSSELETNVKKHKPNIETNISELYKNCNKISEHQVNDDNLKFSVDLDEALRITLSNCKSYSKPLLESKNNVEDLLCNVCSSDAILYRLSCFHLLCRECLVQKSKKTQVICDKCHIPSTISNIVRVHA